MKRVFLLGLTVLATGIGVARADWKVEGAAWRPDANPFARKQVWEQYIWKEGWDDPEQFYPKHFQPAGSLHVVLRNVTARPMRLQLTHVDGKPVGELATTAERIGPVIYQWIEPEQAAAGGWTECIVRLRLAPTADVRLTFQADAGGSFDVLVPIKPRRIRMEAVAFSPNIDRAYVYLRALDGGPIAQAIVELDGKAIEQGVRRMDGPADAGLALLEVPLAPAWEAGSCHLVQITVVGVDRLVQPIRAWDHFFMIGLWGPHPKEKAAEAKAHGINSYTTHGPFDVLHELDMNYILVGTPGGGRPRTAQQSGRVCYYNKDEPDAHDAMEIKTLPLMERLGVNATQQVIPIIRQQRAADATTPNLVLINNTYKPLNWYVYGQLGDITATDPYVPISAEQLERVPCSLAVARDACSPHPLVAVIWATGNTGHRWSQRPPTPQEERMMVFYALGSGINGLAYFADIGIVAEGGKFLALSENKELWEEVGRINKDVAALAPYLSIGCPLPNPPRHEDVWIRSLLCGPEAMATVVVNRGHEIGFNTVNHHAFHFPARDVEIAIPLPAHLRQCRVLEVKDGRLVPIAAEIRDGQAHLKLDVVDTARAFVFTPAVATSRP
ncbi:MAG TPA: hypothetical protein VLM89_14975 [Phycisphaerae bacterium]|nr:hypothetical protein [Phycisphaerae bacterium]